MSSTRIPEPAFAELEQAYRELAQEILRTPARCTACGRCCRFGEQAFVLYASSLEVAYLRRTAPPPPPAPPDGRCPYQKNNLCTVHSARPLGCRVYHSNPEFEPFMAEIYEKYHERVREICSRWEIEYRYRPFLEEIQR